MRTWPRFVIDLRKSPHILHTRLKLEQPAHTLAPDMHELH